MENGDLCVCWCFKCVACSHSHPRQTVKHFPRVETKLEGLNVPAELATELHPDISPEEVLEPMRQRVVDALSQVCVRRFFPRGVFALSINQYQYVCVCICVCPPVCVCGYFCARVCLCLCVVSCRDRLCTRNILLCAMYPCDRRSPTMMAINQSFSS